MAKGSERAKYKTMDGNEAAAYVSYAFTEVAAIYPITPSSPMASHVDEWAAHGKENLFGQPVKLVEMQSEAGACATLQGALEAGSLGATYTSSQGLALMIPPMYRISGLLLPGVMHVAARSLATHSISIFGDHSDVMACRQTGWAQLASSSVQEVMDLGAVAHLSAIGGRIPVQHFFDGFRTSHEIQKIEVLDYEDLRGLVDWEAVARFRRHALNPEHPTLRNAGENDDVFFQHREAANSFYDEFPKVVQSYMDKLSRITGRSYKLFNYYGAEDAENVVVAMGSVCETLRETIAYLNERGKKVGLLQVHLYRPFSAEHMLAELPDSVKTLSVLDRTKEPGSVGEPLYEDVCSAVLESGRRISVLGGRYGLSSKDTSPAQMLAVYANMDGERKNHFTVGITDDVTNRSLPVGEPVDTSGKSIVSYKFWGIGSDGTVGANKNSIKIIGDNTDQYVQAYFQYDAKKSGGVTRSHLRFGHEPIRSTYYVTMADFVACHKQSYILNYDIVSELKPGGTFLLNTVWRPEQLDAHLPNRVKRLLAERNIQFYIIDATDIAAKIGLGNRTSTVLQSAFFKLSGVLPAEQALEYMKQAARNTFAKKGEKVVEMNCLAIDMGMQALEKVEVPPEWGLLQDETPASDASLPHYVRELLPRINRLEGDKIPVSQFLRYADGVVPTGTAKYEKRGAADNVPAWDSHNCIGCNMCSLACSHAAIRPFLFTEEEAASAPESCLTKPAVGKGFEGLRYRIQVSALDCQGCGSCVEVCPAKEKALTMRPLESQLSEQANWDYCLSLSEKPAPMDRFSPKGSQYQQPLYEFSGACPGCGETPYIKLLTQLFGPRLYVANATGCAQAVGFFTPAFPQGVASNGHGPAFSNSLFENNAEFALGLSISEEQQRAKVRKHAQALSAGSPDAALREAAAEWLALGDTDSETERVSAALKEAAAVSDDSGPAAAFVRENGDLLTKKPVWMYGGDGWAYDIGYGGLDHVVATGRDINVLVVDTEVYSNTGGQASKATPTGAVAEFAAAGKATAKKDLGMMLSVYGNVYVAQISLGANPAHAIRCLKEAAAHKGPSVVIAYAPCINHGIVKGMGCSLTEEKLASACGYWPLYHMTPDGTGGVDFHLDSPAPNGKLREFMMGETRFAALTRTFPQAAEELFARAETFVNNRYDRYRKLDSQRREKENG